MGNNSGHSGFSPLLGSVFFIPIIITGILGLTKNKQSLGYRLTLVIGFSGIIFGFLIQTTGIMNEYNNWLHSGMNAQNPNSDIILFIYGSLIVFAIVFVSVISIIQKRKA